MLPKSATIPPKICHHSSCSPIDSQLFDFRLSQNQGPSPTFLIPPKQKPPKISHHPSKCALGLSVLPFFLLRCKKGDFALFLVPWLMVVCLLTSLSGFLFFSLVISSPSHQKKTLLSPSADFCFQHNFFLSVILIRCPWPFLQKLMRQQSPCKDTPCSQVLL